MRDRYLFRGKTEISERWVVGDLVQWSGDDMCICEEYNSTEKKQYSVIPETVGQYTGLNDKNGKKIFEGDIIKSTRAWYVIEFENCGYGLRAFGKTKIIPIMGHWNFNSNEVEVIGNIHDNPELLKGE